VQVKPFKVETEWFKSLRRLMYFPETYVTFDLETSGIDREEDLIVQFGYCVVVDKELVSRDSFLFDWTRRLSAPDVEWFKAKIERVRSDFASRGQHYGMSLDRLCGEGIHPDEALSACSAFFDDWHSQRGYFIGHNVLSFDGPILSSNFKRFASRSFWLTKDMNVIDTGMLAKASQLKLLPGPEERVFDFAHRVARTNGHDRFWSLDRACVPGLGLDKKHGLHAERMHDAEYDAYVTHLLFEEFRSLAEA